MLQDNLPGADAARICAPGSRRSVGKCAIEHDGFGAVDIVDLDQRLIQVLRIGPVWEKTIQECVV